MRRLGAYINLIALVVLLSSEPGHAQESVFSGLKSDVKRADNFYSQHQYADAVALYLIAEKKKKGGPSIYIKLGETYFKLNNNQQSVAWYGKHLQEQTSLPDNDVLNYAEALRGIGDYKEAISQYKIYLKKHGNDQKITEKIWRLTNIEFLLEDSIFYAIRKVDIKLNGSFYSPMFYKDGLVIVGDKKNKIGGFINHDGTSNSSFKTLYFTGLTLDTLPPYHDYYYTELVEFSKDISSRLNIGPVSFYPDETKIVFTKNGESTRKTGSTLQLFIAELAEEKWREPRPMPFNNIKYSVSNPALNEDGNILYFVSDMPGGYGSDDLYVSYYKDNAWSKPQNLGDRVNTSGVESFPYIHHGLLYFASDGHGGLGGLDIYKIDLRDIISGEVINPGYPINTSYDDFGIILNDKGTRGFMSSNRGNGGFSDAIYEIEIDLQTYPLFIAGSIKYKELNWKDSEKFEMLPEAQMYLIDVRRGIQVSESKTDSLGNFKIKIPYASKYMVKVVEASIGEVKVSFEIPKNKKPDTVHDIVIVKNGSLFKQESSIIVLPANTDKASLNKSK